MPDTDPTLIAGFMPSADEWRALVKSYKDTAAELARAIAEISELRDSLAQEQENSRVLFDKANKTHGYIGERD